MCSTSCGSWPGTSPTGSSSRTCPSTPPPRSPSSTPTWPGSSRKAHPGKNILNQMFLELFNLTLFKSIADKNHVIQFDILYCTWACLMAWHLKVKILNMKNIYNGCFHNRISVKSSTRSGVPAIWRTRRWSCSTTWHSSSGRCSSPSSPSPTTSTWAAPSCPWLWIYTKENSNQGIGYGQWRGNIER